MSQSSAHGDVMSAAVGRPIVLLAVGSLVGLLLGVAVGGLSKHPQQSRVLKNKGGTAWDSQTIIETTSHGA